MNMMKRKKNLRKGEVKDVEERIERGGHIEVKKKKKKKMRRTTPTTR